MTESFEVEVWIDAEPTRVFPYFVDADKISQWLSKTAATQLMVGGEMKLVANNDAVAIGEFLVIDPPNQVSSNGSHCPRIQSTIAYFENWATTDLHQ